MIQKASVVYRSYNPGHVFGEKYRFLAWMALLQEKATPQSKIVPYGTFGMEPASL